MIPSLEILFEIHVLNLSLKLAYLNLHCFVFHLLLLKGCFIIDEIGTNQKFAVTELTNITAWYLTIVTKLSFGKVPFLLTAIFTYIIPTEFTEYSLAFAWFEVNFLTWVALFSNRFVRTRSCCWKDIVLVIRL